MLSAIVFEFKDQAGGSFTTDDNSPGMGKKANTSAIRSKQFKFRTDSLSSLLFS